MKQHSTRSRFFLGIAALALAHSAFSGAQAKFSIEPTTPTQIQGFVGQSVTVNYRVTNNTKITRVLTMVPIQGVSQSTGDANSCASPGFILASQQSCVLTLQIKVPNGGIQGRPEVCKTQGPNNNQPDPFLCSQAGEEHRFNVSAAPAIRRVAVGNSNSVLSQPLIYTSQDNGSIWSAPIVLGLPDGGTNGVLLAVACDSSGLLCTTVGSFSTAAGVKTALSYSSTDGGQTWSSAFSPALPANSVSSNLVSVACSSSGLTCTAVGTNVDSNNIAHPISYFSSNGGSTWTLSSTQPISVVNNATSYLLRGVSCSSSGLLCASVGTYTVAHVTHLVGYYSTDGGVNWSVSSAFSPSIGDVLPRNLIQISCDSLGLSCVVVGSGTGTLGSAAVSYTSLNGGQTWTPSVMQPAAFPGYQNGLLGVSCSGSGLICSAVGYSLDSNGNVFNLAYTSLDGGNSWSSPISVASFISDSTMNGVFCDNNAINCTSVGSGSNNNVDQDIYALTSSTGGNAWLGPILITPPQGVQGPNLNAVAGSR